MSIEMTRANQRYTRGRYGKAALLGCSALVALTPLRALAQDATTQSGGTVLETITVQGSGGDDDAKSIVARQATSANKMATDILNTPASISVITAKEIEQRGASNVEKVLQYTSGVNADFYGSDDRYDFFKIRGFDAYTSRDGLALGRPFGAPREETYAFERVEVLKGANSTSGVSDPGGSVNFATKRPKSERFGEAYVTGGVNSRAETGFDFGDNITSDDTLSYRLTGKLRNADAEYDYSRDDQKFFMGGLTWRPTDATSLTVVYDHLNGDGVPGSGGHPVGSNFDRSRFFGEPDFNYRGTNRNTVSVMFDHDFGSGLKFGANARYSNTNTNFGYAYIASTPTNGSTIAERSFFGNEFSSEDFIIDAHLQYDTTFDNIESRTLVGAEYNAYSSTNDTYFGPAPDIDWTNPVYSGRPASVPLYASTSSDQKSNALYLQQELTFAEKFIVSVGLRNDWMDIDETNELTRIKGSSSNSEFTKRIGASYKLTEEVAAYASYAESVAPPSVGLDPETGKQVEVGLKYRPDAFPALFTASVFDLTRQNYAVSDPVTRVQYTVGEAKSRGFELEAKAEITDNINLNASYTYLDTEITENIGGTNVGNRLALVPKHMASLWASYTLEGQDKRGDMTFGSGARYVGSYYYGDANTSGVGGTVVFDAAFSYDIQDNTKLEISASNIFNKKYVANGGFGADFYNPGREVWATLRRTW
ncbi:TonB-dependent siderophore receptor [Rhizobium sp. Leaf262]|uniref:TonB-dependent siderophore receptor n=1 Tax=Rhizobium sp. Leaf262 TaxID=1736312 RepID=UPI0007137121|nr:TonB-dependent siderophore receptor [Rhizobium sp. Leaf262]KQO83606.1 ligand-gated channel [Rhizobium sp. Leaf262]